MLDIDDETELPSLAHLHYLEISWNGELPSKLHIDQLLAKGERPKNLIKFT